MKQNPQRRGLGILIFSIILVIGLIIGLVAVLPQFYIARFDIEGERKLTEEEILLASGLRYDNHLLLYVSGNVTEALQLRYRSTEARLLDAFPYLEDVEVKAAFPYTVQIRVKERIEVAYLSTRDDIAVIDSQGRILERIPPEEAPETMLIRGVEVGPLLPSEYISEESKRQTDRSLLVINAMLRADRDAADDWAMMDQVTSLFPYAANAIYLTIEQNGKPLEIRLNPSRNIEEKILWLRNALQQDAFTDLGRGVVDLSGEQNVFSPSQTVPAIPAPTGTTRPATEPTETTARPDTDPSPTTADPLGTSAEPTEPKVEETAVTSDPA